MGVVIEKVDFLSTTAFSGRYVLTNTNFCSHAGAYIGHSNSRTATCVVKHTYLIDLNTSTKRIKIFVQVYLISFYYKKNIENVAQTATLSFFIFALHAWHLIFLWINVSFEIRFGRSRIKLNRINSLSTVYRVRATYRQCAQKWWFRFWALLYLPW